jgi:hypothetical protein
MALNCLMMVCGFYWNLLDFSMGFREFFSSLKTPTLLGVFLNFPAMPRHAKPASASTTTPLA